MEAEDKVGFIVSMRGTPTGSAALTSHGSWITGEEGEAMESYNSQVNLSRGPPGSSGRHGGAWVRVGSCHGERMNCRHVSEWVGIPVERTHLLYRDRYACCQICLEVCLVLCTH